MAIPIKNPYEGSDVPLKDPWGDGTTRNPYEDEPKPEAVEEEAPASKKPARRRTTTTARKRTTKKA